MSPIKQSNIAPLVNQNDNDAKSYSLLTDNEFDQR